MNNVVSRSTRAVSELKIESSPIFSLQVENPQQTFYRNRNGNFSELQIKNEKSIYEVVKTGGHSTLNENYHTADKEFRLP